MGVCVHGSSVHVFTAHVSVGEPACAMSVSPPPHPAPLRAEQMDTVGGVDESCENKRKEEGLSYLVSFFPQ